MVVKSLESLGYQVQALDLANPSDDDTGWAYYTFDDSSSFAREGLQDIIGTRLHSKRPLLLEVILLHKDERLFPLPDVETIKFASSGLEITPSRMFAFTQFLQYFDALVDGQVALSRSRTYFQQLNFDELLYLHFSPQEATSLMGKCYKYHPAQGLQDTDKITILVLPSLSSRQEANSKELLWLVTFDQGHLENKLFHPLAGSKIEAVKFHQEALRELVTLLRQCSYEHFSKVTRL